MVVLQQFVDVITVVKGFPDTEVQHLHITWTVETGYALTETAVKTAVFEGNHQIMVFLQILKQGVIGTGEVTRVDEGCLERQPLAERFSSLEEIADGDDSHLFAAMCYLITVQITVIGVVSLVAVCHAIGRNTNGNTVSGLVDGPVFHGFPLFPCGRGKVNQIRDMTEHRNIEETDVRKVVHAEDGRTHHVDDGWIAVHTEILTELVIGTLQEGGISTVHNMCTGLCSTRSQGYGFLFGNAYIDILFAQLFAFGLVKTDSSGNGGSNDKEFGILLGLLQQIVAYHRTEILTREAFRIFDGTGLDIERKSPMPAFLILYRRLETISFLCMEMYNDRMVDVLHLSESLDKLFHIIPLFHIKIVETEGLEDVLLRFPLCLSELFQSFINTTMVLGNTHLIVVEHQDEIGSGLGNGIHAFKSLSAGKGTVADDGNDIIMLSL